MVGCRVVEWKEAAAWKSPNKIEVCAMPEDVKKLIEEIVQRRHEATVKLENGNWVVAESARWIVYNEGKPKYNK